MSIILDHQLKEYIPHSVAEFPITYFHDELVTLPDWTGPLHWHPDFEIATAKSKVLDYQVGEQHMILEAGDSIFVNGNILHGVKQLSGDIPDPMPNIVFSGTLVAPETSTIYKEYIQPIVQCDSLPFIVFRQREGSHKEINSLIKEIYRQMNEKRVCYELTIQRNINRIFEIRLPQSHWL
ncbi:MAG: cupin domain-containing protein [Oliverpabstia sp.]|nr:cupin domain-containing protein [Oliverpabstia sp.]